MFLYDGSRELSCIVASILDESNFLTQEVNLTQDGRFVNPFPRLSSDMAIITGVTVKPRRSWSGRHVMLSTRVLLPKTIPPWAMGIHPFVVRDIHLTGKWRVTFEYAVLENAIRLSEEIGEHVPTTARKRIHLLNRRVEDTLCSQNGTRLGVYT